MLKDGRHEPMTITTPISPYFGGVRVAPDRPCWGQPAHKPKLFGREIIFEEFQPMWSRYQTLRTDGQTIFCGI